LADFIMKVGVRYSQRDVTKQLSERTNCWKTK
jgi:hypothetical protein